MGKHAIVEGLTQETRKQRRGALGPLKGLIITASTEDRYRKAAGHFFAYLRRQREPIPQIPELMDALVSEFICELWEEGHSKSLAQDVISSIQHHQPSLKGQLRVSWRYFKAWQQAEVPARAPPHSLQSLAILSGWFQKHQPYMGIALRMGFHAVLRTGELLQIQAKDVNVKDDFVHLYLGQRKTSCRNANVDAVHYPLSFPCPPLLF